MGMTFESNAKVGAGIDFSDPNSPLARYYFRLGDVLFVAVLAGVFILLNFVRLWHTDVWGHLQHGKIMLNTGQFHHRPVLSIFEEHQGATVNYAWLSQVLFALVFRCGAWFSSVGDWHGLAAGTDALRFLLAVLVTVRLTLLYLAFRMISKSSGIALFGIVFIVGVSLGNLAILRPQAVAEVLFAGLILLLARSELGWKSVFGLSALMVLWANVHASFPIGLIAIGACCVGRFVENVLANSRVGKTNSEPKQFWQLAATIAISVAGITLLNPEGWHIWSKTAAMAVHPNVVVMDEWQSLFSPVASARIPYLVCIGLIVIVAILSRQLPSPEHFALLAAFALPPLLHQRAVVWLITVAPWISVAILGSWLSREQPTWWTSLPNFRRTILAGAMVLIAGLWSIPARRLMDGKPPELARSVSEGTPWEYVLTIADPKQFNQSNLAKVLDNYPDHRFQGTVFTSETLGDFFLGPLGTMAPVFIYSHVHLFKADHWLRFVDIRDARPQWRQKLDRAGVNLVVLYAEPKLPLAKELSQDRNWKVLLDEAGTNKKIDPRCRLFVAVRTQPLLPKSTDVKQ